jgi:hypothetical protein
MERELCIFDMSDASNPTSWVCSWLLQERLLKEYAATRVRRAINLKSVPHSDNDLWLFVMLPDAPPVSALLLLLWVLSSCLRLSWRFLPAEVTVNAVRSNPPTSRARVAGLAAQRREQERGVHSKEKRLRRRERLEQYNEEYRLREQ